MPTQSRLRKWVETGLQDRGHPPLDDLVRDARRIGLPWKPLAKQISEKSGERISHKTLTDWFPEYNKPAYDLAAEAS